MNTQLNPTIITTTLLAALAATVTAQAQVAFRSTDARQYQFNGAGGTIRSNTTLQVTRPIRIGHFPQGYSSIVPSDAHGANRFAHAPFSSIVPQQEHDRDERPESHRHHRHDRRDRYDQNQPIYGVPDNGWYAQYAPNNDYIGPKWYQEPNAYTAGRFGYAGPNGYAAPDGYAGPYGYPFDNAVWWDARFHHPYRR